MGPHIPIIMHRQLHPCIFIGLPFPATKAMHWCVGRACLKLFWGFLDKYRHLKMISWTDICKPQSFGGLEILSFHDSVAAATKRLVWNIASKRKSLRVSWVYSKYINNSSFWELECGSDPSWGWRDILKMRDAVKGNIQHIIGDGKATFFWLDPWLHCGGT